MHAPDAGHMPMRDSKPPWNSSEASITQISLIEQRSHVTMAERRHGLRFCHATAGSGTPHGTSPECRATEVNGKNWQRHRLSRKHSNGQSSHKTHAPLKLVTELLRRRGPHESAHGEYPAPRPSYKGALLSRSTAWGRVGGGRMFYE
jgi:hypothetical protein